MQLSLGISSHNRNNECEQSVLIQLQHHGFFLGVGREGASEEKLQALLTLPFWTITFSSSFKVQNLYSLWIRSVNSLKKLAKEKPEHVRVIDN